MMLRFIYRGVLRAHPSWFRRRFADEMLSIFDQTPGPLAAGRLLGDGIISLLRQWTLRPEFWEEPAVPATPNGVPLFHIFESSKPRTEALLYGAFLSLLVLNGVCWTMGYAWNHPSFVWIQQPVISPPEAWKAKAPGHEAARAAGDESLYTDQGRVVLVFKSHTHSAAAAASTSQGNLSSPQSGVEPSMSAQAAVVVDAQTLQSYAGNYIGESGKDSGISISVRDGRLELEMAGQGGSPLTPVTRTKFVAVAIPACSIDFSVNSGGYVRGVQMDCSNSSRFLRRESAPLDF
jgi:hypothetical protein